jgi:hypothetical protein
VPSAGKAPDFEGELKAVVAERTKLETDLEKAQAKLRAAGIDRGAEPEAYNQLLAPVNDLKQRIGDISQRHIQLANMVAQMKGARTFVPPRT